MASRDPAEILALLEAQKRALMEQGDEDLRPSHGADSIEKVDDDAAPLSEMTQVIASRRNKERTAKLQAIERAMVRVREDPEMYGHCITCEEPITPRRLEVVPWADRCLACQEGGEEDGGRRGSRRHLRDFD